jgi:hypothetical protein
MKKFKMEDIDYRITKHYHCTFEFLLYQYLSIYKKVFIFDQVSNEILNNNLLTNCIMGYLCYITIEDRSILDDGS